MKHFYRNKLLINYILVILLASVSAVVSFVIAGKFIPMDYSGRSALIIVIILTGAVPAAVLSYFLAVKYIKPLNELAFKSQNIADIASAVPMNFGDEDVTDILNNTIDYLVVSVKDRDAEIEGLNRRILESKRLSSLGELAAGVAHEINNPLGGITVYSNLLLEDTPEDDPKYSNIKKIIRESDRCKNIVKGLLTIARQGQPKLEQADLHKIISEALNNLKSEDIFKNVRVIEHFGEDLPAVFVDSSQIQEVFENVIRNAAEIMEVSGDLNIISCAGSENGDEGMVVVRFEDTGPGISGEHLKRVFDPFFTTKQKGHGTGLGLALSYGIVERHRGTLTAGNRSGGGAVFTVRLPAFDQPEK